LEGFRVAGLVGTFHVKAASFRWKQDGKGCRVASHAGATMCAWERASGLKEAEGIPWKLVVGNERTGNADLDRGCFGSPQA
jgi:hypothetical protein